MAEIDNHHSRREDLIEQLVQNTYECMICFEKVLSLEPIWSCAQCHNIFHLPCIQHWIQTSLQLQTEFEEHIQEPIRPEMITWRCPGCQLTNQNLPEDGLCFCGKLKNPEHLENQRIPHSCGQVFHRLKHAAVPAPSHDANNCAHSCLLPCHPGPCPPCQILVIRTCECGKTQVPTSCRNSSQAVPLHCTEICYKVKICGKHKCPNLCHGGGCGPCDVLVALQCNCGKESKAMECSAAARVKPKQGIRCWHPCEKTTDGGLYSCQKYCHSGRCRFAKVEKKFSWAKRIFFAILTLICVGIPVKVVYIYCTS